MGIIFLAFSLVRLDSVLTDKHIVYLSHLYNSESEILVSDSIWELLSGYASAGYWNVSIQQTLLY